MLRQRLLGALKQNNCSYNLLRYGHGVKEGQGSIPGENLPLNLNWSKAQFTLVFTLFFGIGLGAPWFVIMHQMTRS